MVESPVRNGTIAVSDDGTIVRISDRIEEGSLRIRGVVLPALANAHVHFELSSLRHLVPGGRGMIPWALSMRDRRKDISAADRERAIYTAVEEAISTGTGCVGEVTRTMDAAPALTGSGLRGVLFHQVSEDYDRPGETTLEIAARIRANHEPIAGDFHYSLAPHSTHSASRALIRAAMGAFPDAPTSIHLAEDRAQVEHTKMGTGPMAAIAESIGAWRAGVDPIGLSPLEYLETTGALDRRGPTLLVHLVHASERDLLLARSKGCVAVVCPRSNLHIGGEPPDLSLMDKLGLRIAIGTDSLASCPDLSLWRELLVLRQHFPSVAASRLVEMATKNGADALGQGEQMGRLEPGLRPGVIAVEGEAGEQPFEFLVERDPMRVQWLPGRPQPVE